MAIETTTVRNAIVYRSVEYPHRWYDAFGEGVTKYITDCSTMPTDNTTGMPTEWTNTLVGASTFGITDVSGGAVLLTTAAADNDGVKLQLGSEVGTAGESVDLSLPYWLYFGINWQQSVVTQADFLAGVCVTDTTCLDGVDTGMYFRNVDGVATLYFVTEKDTIESQTAVATLVAASNMTAEFLVDPTYVYAYINGSLVCSVARTDATFPNDELMRLTIEFLTGDNAAITATINWVRIIHIR